MVTKTELLFALLLTGALSRGHSQTIAPSILNTGGSSAIINGNTYEYSFGELLSIQTFASANSPNLTIVSGVLQPYDVVTILPVTLTRFQGAKMAGYNKLDWATGFETGNTRFELERSTDGQRFAGIYTAPARGAANGSTYTYNDYQPFQGKVFYRLRIIEASGQAKYSSIVAISSFLKNEWAMYPNPVSRGSELQVTVQNAGMPVTSTLTLLDVLGRKVYESKQPLVTGFQAISVALNIAPGLYTVVLTGFEKNSTQKLIVK